MEPDNFPYNVQQDMQSIEPVGIAPLVSSDMQNNSVMGPSQIDPKQIAGNILKNQTVKFVGRKLGLGQIGKNVLGSIIGLSTPFAPLVAVSALSGPALGIANVLRNKRVEKAIMRDVNRDSQGDINIVDQRIANMQPSARDRAMGNPTSKQAPSKSVSAQNPYSGGPGGVQSGL
jgi:hypothetical protein